MIRRCLPRRRVGTIAAAVIAPLALTTAPLQRSVAAETRAWPPTAATTGAATRSWTPPFADDRCGDDGADDGERRLYVTGMVGSSLSPPVGGAATGPLGNATVSGEGAIGVAIPQTVGDWRFEVEGRHRPAARTAGTASAGMAAHGTAGRHAADDATPAAAGWATTANAWRDLPLVGRVAAYAGGGIGCGGGGPGEPRGGTLAWQTGGGLAWAWHDRLTLDVGYRLHGQEAIGGRPSATPAGEVLFAVRLYEPFRRWGKE